MSEPKPLIKIQNAHVSEIFKSGTTTRDYWSVRENVTNEELYKLPPEWDEGIIFKVLDFVKEFELKALNIGINFGVTRLAEKHSKEVGRLTAHCKALEESNEKLANKLSKLMRSYEDS